MTTAQGLRKIARKDWEAGHILTVNGLQVGIRFHHPFLKQPLQDWLDEEPEGELANKLYHIGMRSRDPEVGHGYIDLTSMGASAPRKWRDGVGRESVQFSSELNKQLRALLQRETQIHISGLVHELERSLIYLRHSRCAGMPDEEVVGYVRFEARTGFTSEEFSGAEFMGNWARAILDSKAPRSDYMPYLI